jgi:hypothetical protein
MTVQMPRFHNSPGNQAEAESDHSPRQGIEALLAVKNDSINGAAVIVM